MPSRISSRLPSIRIPESLWTSRAQSSPSREATIARLAAPATSVGRHVQELRVGRHAAELEQELRRRQPERNGTDHRPQMHAQPCQDQDVVARNAPDEAQYGRWHELGDARSPEYQRDRDDPDEQCQRLRGTEVEGNVEHRHGMAEAEHFLQLGAEYEHRPPRSENPR
jgi:hypothetical protein